jgi:hypothetical protein
MDIATIIGFLLAFGMMYASVIMGGGQMWSFYDTHGIRRYCGSHHDVLSAESAAQSAQSDDETRSE